MKKVTRLTESELVRLVKRVIKEQEPKEVVKDSRKNFSQMKNLEIYKGCTVQKIYNTLRVNCPESTIDTGVFFDAKIS